MLKTATVMFLWLMLLVFAKTRLGIEISDDLTILTMAIIMAGGLAGGDE